ncbi:MAG: rod-binding protein [Spirochaetes bacterium]|nr:rod-binding protein [Spirochaetota bacterium]
MEITDILKPESFNINTNLKTITSNKENKFQNFLNQSLNRSTEDKNNIYSANNHQKQIDTKLMNVCIEMESIFVSRMLKEMRNTLPEEKLIDGGFAEKIFEDMLYDEYALNLSKTSNLGLAKMLYEDLSGK